LTWERPAGYLASTSDSGEWRNKPKKPSLSFSLRWNPSHILCLRPSARVRERETPDNSAQNERGHPGALVRVGWQGGWVRPCLVMAVTVQSNAIYQVLVGRSSL